MFTLKFIFARFDFDFFLSADHFLYLKKGKVHYWTQKCKGHAKRKGHVKPIVYRLFLHKQSLCDSMNSLFSQPKSQIVVFILSVILLQYVHKINNQLLSTANATDIKTDYTTNST